MRREPRMQLVMRSISQRAEMLRRTGWAEGLSPDQTEVLARHLESYAAAGGCTLIREGAKNASVAIIVAGSVERLLPIEGYRREETRLLYQAAESIRAKIAEWCSR